MPRTSCTSSRPSMASPRRRRRLLARRQPRAQARRRVRRRIRPGRSSPSPRCRRSSRSASARSPSSGRENVLYQWNFVKDLKRRMRRKDQRSPGRFDLRTARRDANRPRVRRGLHGAVFGFAAPRTIITAPARCASWIASACRRSSSPPKTIRSCPPQPFRDPESPAIPTSSCACARTAATVASSARRKRMTTGTGRSGRSSSSWRGRRRPLGKHFFTKARRTRSHTKNSCTKRTSCDLRVFVKSRGGLEAALPHSWVFNAELLEVGLVLGRIVILLLHRGD